MKKATGKKLLGPSRASLREMPEVNLDKAKVRRNPYALRIAAEGISIHVGRGRPRKGTETVLPRRAKDLVDLDPTITQAGDPLLRRESGEGQAALRAAVMAWINKETERP